MLMAPPLDSAGSGASFELRTDHPAAAIVMKDRYCVPRQNLFRAPPDEVLKTSPFVLLRADHGHGALFDSVMGCVQPRAYQDLLDVGSGLFHATTMRCLLPILRDGILKMGRAASMFSMLIILTNAVPMAFNVLVLPSTWLSIFVLLKSQNMPP